MADSDNAAAAQAKIVAAAQQAWTEKWVENMENSVNCSGFFKAVLQKLNVTPAPNHYATADDLVDYMDKNWTPLKDETEAWHKVQAGFLVGAGLKAADQSAQPKNGHVSIIVDGKRYHGKYPMCWSGSINPTWGQSQGNKSIGEVFSTSDRDNVHYYMYPKPLSAGK